MAQQVIVRGRYVNQRFIPEGDLPDTEGSAELIITPRRNASPISVFDFFGKAARLRSAADIAAQVEEERKEWSEP